MARAPKRVFFIKKRILARDPAEALRREGSATITDVWTEQVDVHAVGFHVTPNF